MTAGASPILGLDESRIILIVGYYRFLFIWLYRLLIHCWMNPHTFVDATPSRVKLRRYLETLPDVLRLSTDVTIVTRGGSFD